MGFIEVYKHPVYYSSSIILSHEPVKEAYDNPYVYNVHGHLHQSVVDLPNFINANIELYDYKPISLKALQEDIGKKTKSRKERFGEEWYFQYFKRLSEEN